MAREYFASSPTVVLPPPQQPNSYFPEQSQQPTSFDALPPSANDATSFNHQPPPLAAVTQMQMAIDTDQPSPLTPSATAAAGRKRSRGEVLSDDPDPHESLDDGSAMVDSAVDIEPPTPRGEPVYGPGMTLIYPDDPGFSVISAGSQTGTWHEEQAATAQTRITHASRPSFSTRKSQRLDRTAAGPDDIELATQRRSPSPPKMAQEPTIDDAARALGIGWSLVQGNPELEIPARAYSKYIENHFALTAVQLLVHSKSMPAYLVSATEPSGQHGFYLFQEDLQRGQLVSTTWEQTLTNLRSSPIIYEGGDLLVALRTPSVAGVIGLGPTTDATAIAVPPVPALPMQVTDGDVMMN